MAKKLPWGTRLAWYFYNNPEFFEKSDADLENDARELAGNGANVVMLFTMTHFRWSFYPYWDRIGNLLQRICTAFHKYGIRVVEHHSTSLCECPLPIEEWDDREGGIFRERGLYFTSDKKRYGPYLDQWEKVKAFVCNPDAMVEGIPFVSMVQVDGRTGQRSVSNYKTSVMCYNNEDFRRIYFAYLASLYQCGIDGIMTDDVQFFNNGNACACPACRRLFKEETGYELPRPEDWEKGFSKNHDNPAFVAFNKFKLDSAERFQRDVNAHFRSLGYDMLRIDYYGSSMAYPNITSYPFHRCAPTKDLVFQENLRTNVTKLSWPSYYTAAAYLYAIGREHGVPSMSVFYDAKDFNIYFGWAMSVAWGQMFNGSYPYTQETMNATRFLRDFERRYPYLVYQLDKCADAAVFFSGDMLDLWQDETQEIFKSVPVWLQSGMFSGLCMDVVNGEIARADPTKWSNNPILIIPNIHMLSDDQIKAFGDYARAGGRLILCGLCGIRDEQLRPRSPERIKALLASHICMKPLDDTFSFTLPGLSPMPFETVYEGGEVVAASEKGAVYVREKTGEGEILYIGVAAYKIPHQRSARGNRPTAISAKSDTEQLARPNLAPPYTVDILKSTLGRLLHQIIREPLISLDKHGEYLTTVYDTANKEKRVVHMVNIKDTLQAEGTPYAFETVIPAFNRFGQNDIALGKNTAMILDVAFDRIPSGVHLLTPENNGPTILPYQYQNKRLTIKLPQGLFSGYAAIEIQ